MTVGGATIAAHRPCCALYAVLIAFDSFDCCAPLTCQLTTDVLRYFWHQKRVKRQPVTYTVRRYYTIAYGDVTAPQVGHKALTELQVTELLEDHNIVIACLPDTNPTVRRASAVDSTSRRRCRVTTRCVAARRAV